MLLSSFAGAQQCPSRCITTAVPGISHDYVRARWGARHSRLRACHEGPHQQAAPAARRLYDAALSDSLHDLSLDFNTSYLRVRCHHSVPVCMEDEDDTAAQQITPPPLDRFEAYLNYQHLVSPVNHPQQGTSRLQLPESDLQHQTVIQGMDQLTPGAASTSSRPAGSIDLLHCAVLIARHAHPSSDLKHIRAVITELGRQAAGVAARAHGGAAAGSGAGGSSVRALAAAVSSVLYDVEGFTGAVDDFYHPDNQCINRLLETKQGSPALLALLHKLVAAEAGLHLTAVTLPGHTFLQPTLDSTTAATGKAAPYLIDPFNAGQVCSSSVVEARLNACWGYPGQTLSLGPHHLGPHHLGASTGSAGLANAVSWRGDRALLVRLLKNLREAYYGPLPLSGRIRWAMHLRESGLIISSTASSEAAAALDKLIAAAAAATSVSSFSGISADGEAGESPSPAGRELLLGALAAVRYHRATDPQEVRLLRDEGYILHLLGRSAEGSALLQQYLTATPAAADMHKVQEFVVTNRQKPPFI